MQHWDDLIFLSVLLYFTELDEGDDITQYSFLSLCFKVRLFCKPIC